MEELDGDEVRVSSRGVYAERDIVQVSSCYVTCYFIFIDCSVFSKRIAYVKQNYHSKKLH